MDPTLANAARLLKRRARRANPAMPTLWMVTDERRLADPTVAISALPRGSGVILRHYGVPNRAAIAKRLAGLCRRRGIVLLIAGDWRLAATVGAAGLHLAEHAARLGLAPGGRLWVRGRVLTMAAHGGPGITVAARRGATAAVLAPVFTTASHPGREALGRLRTRCLVRRARIPVIALGGINARTVNALKHSGCAGIAGVGFALE
jgi:thiamine-phosphate pyrophosphorylase